MHEVLIAEGIVLSKRPAREADLLVSVLTEHGLVRARASGARKEASKLRYALEPLCLARFSFVRGKYEHKLTGAVAPSRAFLGAALAERQAMARVARLLLRLIHGQEPSPRLYGTVREGFEALCAAGGDRARLESIEVVLVLRVLSELGYLPQTPALAPFVEGEFSVELSARALEARALLVRAVNESLQATGL